MTRSTPGMTLRGDLAARRRVRDPGRAELEVEEDGARQADGAQDVREDVNRHDPDDRSWQTDARAGPRSGAHVLYL